MTPLALNPPRRCDCGQPVAVIGRGRFQITARHCTTCANRLAVAEEVAQRLQRSADRLRAAGLDTPRRRDWSFETFPRDTHTAPAIRRAVAWATAYRHAVTSRAAAPRGHNLVLYGPVGTGKTGIAHATLRSLVDLGHHGTFTATRDLLDDARDAYRDNRRPTLLDRAATTPVLVLDDLGAERSTPWAVEQLAGIIDRRHAHQLPTITTSNHDPDQLLRRLAGTTDAVDAQRLVSRLVDDAELIRLDGHDRRLHPRAR